jgi:hypothetical protein
LKTLIPKLRQMPHNNLQLLSPMTTLATTILATITPTTTVKARLSTVEMPKRMTTMMMERKWMLKVLRTKILSWS